MDRVKGCALIRQVRIVAFEIERRGALQAQSRCSAPPTVARHSFLLLAITNISIILIVFANIYIREDDETRIKPQEALL